MIRIILLSVSIIMLSTFAYAETYENSACEEGKSGEPCACSNGLPGKCDSGSAKPGLYCHCDDHPPATKKGNSDGCESQGQLCPCSQYNWEGKCDSGSAQPGLYCHCIDPAAKLKEIEKETEEKAFEEDDG